MEPTATRSLDRFASTPLDLRPLNTLFGVSCQDIYILLFFVGFGRARHLQIECEGKTMLQ